MAEPQVIAWCCGEHPFLLRIGEAEALDDLTKDGIADFRYRLRQGVDRGELAYSPVKQREVIDCIRLGLIGGGLDQEKARKLALQAWDEGEFAHLVLLAYSITTHCLAGKPHDPPGKAEPAKATTKRKSGSASQPSTATAR